MIVIDKTTFTRLARAVASSSGVAVSHCVFLEASAAALGFQDVNAATALLGKRAVIVGMPADDGMYRADKGAFGPSDRQVFSQIARFLHGAGGPVDGLREEVIGGFDPAFNRYKWLYPGPDAKLEEALLFLLFSVKYGTSLPEGIERVASLCPEDQAECFRNIPGHVAAGVTFTAALTKVCTARTPPEFRAVLPLFQKWDMSALESRRMAGELKDALRGRDEAVRESELRRHAALEPGTLVDPDIVLDYTAMEAAMSARLEKRTGSDPEFRLPKGTWSKAFREAVVLADNPIPLGPFLTKAAERAIALDFEASTSVHGDRWSRVDTILKSMAEQFDSRKKRSEHLEQCARGQAC